MPSYDSPTHADTARRIARDYIRAHGHDTSRVLAYVRDDDAVRVSTMNASEVGNVADMVEILVRADAR